MVCGAEGLHDGAVRSLGRTAEMPAAIAPRGVEFIEFAASHAEAEEFTTIFTALGFERTGRHRSKDVERWQQGGINLSSIPNPKVWRTVSTWSTADRSAPSALPSMTNRRHGAGRGFGHPPFQPERRPDEWQIPAVRGWAVRCSIWSMPPRDADMWAQEFPDSTPATATGLTRVDHIAQTMQYEEMLSWLLYYTALFDFAKTPQLEISDPMGIVYSQAVESRNAAKPLRFTLNGSMAANALSTRFLHNYFGAGVQHIAFACDDIFAVAARAAAGLPFLAIGPNYYEDLEARFGLDPELVARMAEHNILYDRDERANISSSTAARWPSASFRSGPAARL
jgi:4-hydroxyphenylpyruvate dioxygenase